MNTLYQRFIYGKEKAVVAFVVGLVIAYFAKHGLDLNTLTVADALRLIVAGVLSYMGVYFKRNNR